VIFGLKNKPSGNPVSCPTIYDQKSHMWKFNGSKNLEYKSILAKGR
jgi:hypothetical protein